MLATTSQELSQAIDDLHTLSAAALTDQTAERFTSIEQMVNRIDSCLREMQQSLWRPQIKKAVEHLETGRQLTREDVATIRAVMVSDAEFYLKMENNFGDWLEELQRLVNEMAELAAVGGEEALCDLRGVTRDAVRLVPNIRAYVEEKERLAKFEAAMSRLDAANRSHLAQVMREKLVNPHR